MELWYDIVILKFIGARLAVIIQMRKILIAIFIRFSREVRANLVPSTLDVFATMVGGGIKL